MPRLYRRYTVGLGNTTQDTAYLGSYETGGHRYDFASIAILPDGRVATSFMDESTSMPFPTTGNQIEASAVAVELNTTQPAASPPATPRLGVFVVLGAGGVGAVALRRRRRGAV